jgi:hypothetical protein
MVAGFDCRGCAGWFALVATSPPTDLKGWQLPLGILERNYKSESRNPSI